MTLKRMGQLFLIKRGLALPNPSNLFRIASVLRVEPSYLLLGGQLIDCLTCGNRTTQDLQVCTICATESQKQLVVAVEVIENLVALK